jgi:hypothetical protein
MQDVMFDTFRLTISLGNDAMRGGPDVARALRQVADRIENDLDARGNIWDENGNTVGNFEAVNA